MRISLIGVSHRTAPVEVRERLDFPEKDLPKALQSLKETKGVNEALLLSTCNRVEVLATCDDGIEAKPLVADFFARHRRMARETLDPCLYDYEQRDAVRHIFRVAASLDSMVVGEPQILGQIKTAYATARAVGTMGGTLDEILTHAFAAAKRVRSETGIAASAVSVSYAAVELARKIFGELEGKTVFLIGAGKMTELAARHLRRSGAASIFVANRTYERALELARELEGEAIRFDALLDTISRADIVISSTGSPVYIIKKDHAKRLLKERRNRPMFFIDIAVPRDIDPALNEFENLFVYDIDDLEHVIEANKKQRQHEAVRAEELIEEEVEGLLRRLKQLEVGPTLAELQRQLHGLRQAELDNAHIQGLSDEQRKAVDDLTRRLVNKILHGPLVELKRVPEQPDGFRMVEFARRMFRLKDEN